MADTFQNVDLEKINADVKNRVQEILAGIDTSGVKAKIKKLLEEKEQREKGEA